jgi:hypothetical protein
VGELVGDSVLGGFVGGTVLKMMGGRGVGLTVVMIGVLVGDTVGGGGGNTIIGASDGGRIGLGVGSDVGACVGDTGMTGAGVTSTSGSSIMNNAGRTIPPLYSTVPTRNCGGIIPDTDDDDVPSCCALIDGTGNRTTIQQQHRNKTHSSGEGRISSRELTVGRIL